MGSMKHVWDDVADALDTGLRHTRDGVGGRLRGQRAKIDSDRSRIDATDNEQASKAAVAELEVNSFRGLQSREVVGDAMQHDHIPSKAAIIRARELELGYKLSPAERRAVMNEGTSIELADEIHKLSRTYGSKNKKLIEDDARDLTAAMERDLAVLRANLVASGRFETSQIDEAIQNVRDRNATLGI